MTEFTKSLSEHEQYVKSYLTQLRDIASDFESIFSIFKWIFVVGLGLQVIILLGSLFTGGFYSFLSVAYLVIFAAGTALTVWFWSLCVRLARLQKTKIEHDVSTTYSMRVENKRTASEILAAAEKRAETMIDASGDNNVILVGSGSISGVSQNKTITGGDDLAQFLALLIAYAEESDSEDAAKLANEFADEAAKASPDKGALATLWAGISAAVPTILGVTKIVSGVKGLF